MKTIELLSTRSAVTDVTTVGFFLVDLTTFAIQVTFTGADVVGTLKLQGSVDNVTYVDISNSSQAVTASANHLWDVTRAGYTWVKVDWDYTSGTGNITINLVVKENVVRYA